jgi:Putative auto-transporter adhesin, head GIN domain
VTSVYEANTSFMRYPIIVFLIVFATIPSFSQLKETKIEEFNSISAFGPFKINLIKSSVNKMEIDYNDINSEEVTIKVKKGELSIKLRNRSFFDFGDDSNWEKTNHRYANVIIYYKEISSIEVRAGATVDANEAIVAKQLFLACKMGAEMELEVKAQTLELESSMGSEVKLRGSAEDVKIKSKMGSSVNASSLKSQKVRVSSSMGSEVSVFAEKELDASADFGASITYRGNPAIKNTSRFLGAEIGWN